MSSSTKEILDKVELHFETIANLIVSEKLLPSLFKENKDKI